MQSERVEHVSEEGLQLRTAAPVQRDTVQHLQQQQVLHKGMQQQQVLHKKRHATASVTQGNSKCYTTAVRWAACVPRLRLLHQRRHIPRLPQLAVAAHRKPVPAHCASNSCVQQVCADLVGV